MDTLPENREFYFYVLHPPGFIEVDTRSGVITLDPLNTMVGITFNWPHYTVMTPPLLHDHLGL